MKIAVLISVFVVVPNPMSRMRYGTVSSRSLGAADTIIPAAKPTRKRPATIA